MHTLDGAALKKASNLSDLASLPTARTNLGLGDSATKATGTTAGTVAAGDDSRIVGAAQKTSNLSDLSSASSARTNLGLGDSATKATGTVAGTVAAGDDGRIAAAALKASNLSDLANFTTARTNLGLGALAVLSAVNNAQWSGTALAVSNGGTGGNTAATGRTGLGLGSVEDKSSVTIRGELTKANLDAAAGAAVARVSFGSATNSGLISWGTAAPGTLAEGEIYLRYA